MRNDQKERPIDFPSTALILAGGLGKRLRAAVSDRPKVLAQVAGRPFLHYVLTFLAGQGIRQVVLCVGYMASQVQEFAGDGRSWGLQVSYSQESTPLGTGGALLQARAQMSGPFFALNGDTLFMVDMQALWQAHASARSLATMALLPVQDGSARGCVTLAQDGKITSFQEKPPEAGIALVNGGVYVLEPSALDSLEAGSAASVEREVFPHLAAQGQLAGLIQQAYFADIGTPQSLSDFEHDLVAGVVRL